MPRQDGGCRSTFPTIVSRGLNASCSGIRDSDATARKALTRRQDTSVSIVPEVSRLNSAAANEDRSQSRRDTADELLDAGQDGLLIT
jgi:hypothetical protein